MLLFLFTGSLLQPLRALLLNVVGLAATLGAMVLIFQDGYLSGWLGFTPLPLDTSMLVLLFCIAFGLSMDYEVFVLSRIKEQHDDGVALVRRRSPTGLARSGRIVSMAAVILSVSFFAFGTSVRQLHPALRHRHRPRHPDRRHPDPRHPRARRDASARPVGLVVSRPDAPPARPDRHLRRSHPALRGVLLRPARRTTWCI